MGRPVCFCVSKWVSLLSLSVCCRSRVRGWPGWQFLWVPAQGLADVWQDWWGRQEDVLRCPAGTHTHTHNDTLFKMSWGDFDCLWLRGEKKKYSEFQSQTSLELQHVVKWAIIQVIVDLFINRYLQERFTFAPEAFWFGVFCVFAI